MTVPVHHRIYWILSPCEHTINCNCNHTIGGPAFCLLCGKMRTVMDVQDQPVYPRKETAKP